MMDIEQRRRLARRLIKDSVSEIDLLDILEDEDEPAEQDAIEVLRMIRRANVWVEFA